MKMYIFVKKSLKSHKVVGVAHGVLIAHLKFSDNPDYQDWLKNSFKKVICEVTDEEFELLKTNENYIVVTESTLGHMETSLVFCPRKTWHESFKKFPLMKI